MWLYLCQKNGCQMREKSRTKILGMLELSCIKKCHLGGLFDAVTGRWHLSWCSGSSSWQKISGLAVWIALIGHSRVKIWEPSDFSCDFQPPHLYRSRSKTRRVIHAWIVLLQKKATLEAFTRLLQDIDIVIDANKCNLASFSSVLKWIDYILYRRVRGAIASPLCGHTKLPWK